MAELRFDNKVAIITGAGAGLGREYALFFAKRGAKVLVNDLGKTKSGEFTAALVVAEIKAAGGIAAANTDSVDQGDKIVAQCIEVFGGVHIVINNAGILRDISFMKMKESDWDIIMKVHMKGSFTVARAAWPHLRKQGYGRIINTSSGSGLYGSFGQVNYSAAKMGLHGFTRALSLEGEQKGIFTNTIVPTAATAMTRTVMSEELLKAFEAEHIVPMVAYLCHESCTKSGALYELGGGWVSELRWQRTPGVNFDLPHTPEDIAAKFEQIGDFEREVDYPTSSKDALNKIFANYERVQALKANKAGNEQLKSAGIFQMLGSYLGKGEGLEAVKKCQATYNFNITERKNGPVKGKWAIDLKNGNGAVFAKHFEQADATFTLDDEEFYNQCMIKSNPQMAFLKIAGSMKKASNFVPEMFPMPTPENMSKYASAKL